MSDARSSSLAQALHSAAARGHETPGTLQRFRCVKPPGRPPMVAFLAATLQLTIMQAFKSSISAPRAPGVFSRPVVQRCPRCSATKRVIEPAYFPVSGGGLDGPGGSLPPGVCPPTHHTPCMHRRRAQEVFSGAAERVFASGSFLKREEVSEAHPDCSVAELVGGHG